MSWSAAVAGTPSYHAQPYANGPPPYRQPPCAQYPSGQNFPPFAPPQRPPENRVPKKKGNPIITRYPPPPGYRGPAQPRAPFGTNSYPAHFQIQQGQSHPPQPSPAFPAHGYLSSVAPQGLPAQGYGPSHQAFAQQQYPANPQHLWSQPNHSNHVSFPAHGHSHPGNNYQAYPPQATSVNHDHHNHNPPPAWPSGFAPTTPFQNGPYTTHSGPVNAYDPVFNTNAHPHGAPSQAAPSQSVSATTGTETDAKTQLFLAWDDWDFDFEGAIWPKSNEPVDPNLSLGVIIWHPAKQVTRALPATFAEAEEQSLTPAPETLGNGESVSMYFTAENSHEAFLDVRQTDEWERIRNDPIFVIFSDEKSRQNLVTLEDCVAQRNRPDEPSDEAIPNDDQEMHDAAWNVMDHLEQALSTANPRTTSSADALSQPKTPSTPQEDVLAALGVTGAPKPPSNEPLPPQIAQYTCSSSRTLPRRPDLSSANSALSQTLPPQVRSNIGAQQDHSIMPQPRADGLPLRPDETSGVSPVVSETSDHTMAGSDFELKRVSGDSETPDPEKPSLQRSYSSSYRKRSYEDADHGENDSRQQDEHTKRKRRSQVDAVYSRR